MKEQANAPQDLPPQLLFVHQVFVPITIILDLDSSNDHVFFPSKVLMPSIACWWLELSLVLLPTWVVFLTPLWYFGSFSSQLKQKWAIFLFFNSWPGSERLEGNTLAPADTRDAGFHSCRWIQCFNACKYRDYYSTGGFLNQEFPQL